MQYRSKQQVVCSRSKGYRHKRSPIFPICSIFAALTVGYFLVLGLSSLSFEGKPQFSPAVLDDAVAANLNLPAVGLVAPEKIPLDRELPIVSLEFGVGGKPVVDVAHLDAQSSGRYAAQTPSGDIVYFTPDPALQSKAEQILKTHRVPWGAIVAVDPSSGKILALASYSEAEPNGEPVALRSTFPAASLFKVVTAAAALEKTNLRPNDKVSYRGGTYTLNNSNYLPDERRDSLSMSFRSALGKSCNPVFARIGLKSLSPADLLSYAEGFGFNAPLAVNFTLPESRFILPQNDLQQARTAAGFGPVTISPLHAALVAAAIANGGVMMRPRYIDEVRGLDGAIVYRSESEPLKRVILSSTADELMDMLRETVEAGTAKRVFGRAQPFLRSVPIAAKTGTLSGEDPKGRYLWLIAAAPAAQPEIAVAALVIDPGNARINGAGLGKEFLEHYFANP